MKAGYIIAPIVLLAALSGCAQELTKDIDGLSVSASFIKIGPEALSEATITVDARQDWTFDVDVTTALNVRVVSGFNGEEPVFEEVTLLEAQTGEPLTREVSQLIVCGHWLEVSPICAKAGKTEVTFRSLVEGEGKSCTLKLRMGDKIQYLNVSQPGKDGEESQDEAKPDILLTDRTSLSIPREGGSLRAGFTVMGEVFTFKSNDPWIEIEPGFAMEKGKTVLTLNVGANPSTVRRVGAIEVCCSKIIGKDTLSSDLSVEIIQHGVCIEGLKALTDTLSQYTDKENPHPVFVHTDSLLITYANGKNAYGTDGMTGLFFSEGACDLQAGTCIKGNFYGAGYKADGLVRMSELVYDGALLSQVESFDPISISATELMAEPSKYLNRLVRIEGTCIEPLECEYNRYLVPDPENIPRDVKTQTSDTRGRITDGTTELEVAVCEGVYSWIRMDASEYYSITGIFSFDGKNWKLLVFEGSQIEKLENQ